MAQQDSKIGVSGVFIETGKITAEKDTQWISVKERLPEINKSVLVNSLDFFTTGEPVVIVGSYTGKAWHQDWCRDDDDLIEITHWMPLPEPPKL